jgi:hypothetical protein
MLGSLLSEQKVNHPVGDAPTNKVELGNRSHNLLVSSAEGDPLRPTERIKQLFRVAIQT